MTKEEKIQSLLEQRAAAKLLPCGSQSKEYRLISAKLSYLKNPERQKQYAKEYRKQNYEREKLRARERYARSPEKQLAWNRAWREKNRHKQNCPNMS